MKIILAFTFLFAVDVYADDFRSLTNADIGELAKQFATKLSSCEKKQWKIDLQDIANKTSESVDKNVLLEALRSELKDISKGEALSLSLESRTTESNKSFHVHYKLKNINKSKAREFCEAEAWVSKESSNR